MDSRDQKEAALFLARTRQERPRINRAFLALEAVSRREAVLQEEYVHLLIPDPLHSKKLALTEEQPFKYKYMQWAQKHPYLNAAGGAAIGGGLGLGVGLAAGMAVPAIPASVGAAAATTARLARTGWSGVKTLYQGVRAGIGTARTTINALRASRLGKIAQAGYGVFNAGKTALDIGSGVSSAAGMLGNAALGAVKFAGKAAWEIGKTALSAGKAVIGKASDWFFGNNDRSSGAAGGDGGRDAASQNAPTPLGGYTNTSSIARRRNIARDPRSGNRPGTTSKQSRWNTNMETESIHILDLEPFASVAYQLSGELLGKQTRQFPAIPTGQSAMVSKMDEGTASLLEDFNRLIGDDLPRTKPVYREDLDTLVFIGLLAEMADLTIDQFLDLEDAVMDEATAHSLPILSEMSGDDAQNIPELLRSGGNSLRDQILVLVNEPRAIQAAHNLAVALGTALMDEAARPRAAKVGHGVQLAGMKRLGAQMAKNPAEKRLMKNKGLALRMAKIQAEKMGLSSSVAAKMAKNPGMVLGGSVG